VYERHLHKAECVSEEWVARCRLQLEGALAHLDKEALGPWFFGAALTQADVTVGCLTHYLELRLNEAFLPGQYPALRTITAQCDTLHAFVVTQPAADEVMPAPGTARR
jgi:glutathione S-transferase